MLPVEKNFFAKFEVRDVSYGHVSVVSPLILIRRVMLFTVMLFVLHFSLDDLMKGLIKVVLLYIMFYYFAVLHMFHIMLRRIMFCGVVRCYTTWPCVRFIYGVGNFDNNLLFYLYTFFLYRSIFCVLPILLQYLVFVISIFQRKVRLTRDEFEEIFDHYDKVGDPKLLNDVDCKIMIKIMWVNCG